MPGLSRALEPAQGSKVAFGRLLLPPVTKKGLFFGPKKRRKIRDANTGLPSIWKAANKLQRYRGGPHMRSLISIDFPASEMEPESAHVVSAVSVP